LFSPRVQQWPRLSTRYFNMKKQGFTLTEVIVAAAIIGIILGIGGRIFAVAQQSLQQQMNISDAVRLGDNAVAYLKALDFDALIDPGVVSYTDSNKINDEFPNIENSHLNWGYTVPLSTTMSKNVTVTVSWDNSSRTHEVLFVKNY